jgi:hypothetical protein
MSKHVKILIIMLLATAFAIQIHVAKNKLTAKLFLITSNTSLSVMEGMDLIKSVRVYEAQEGEVFIQYQTPNSQQGDFYGLPGSTPTGLGISEVGYDPQLKKVVEKEKRTYKVVKKTDMLASYASPVIDNWSTPEIETKTGGRERQFFSKCKECFKQVR